MGLKGNWIDRVDGESYVLADDINKIAAAVIEQEETREETQKTIDDLSNEIGNIVSLPDPSNIEDGKVLKVVDGEWAAADDEVGSNASEYSIPTFDLASLGLTSVPTDGTVVQLEMDTTDIMAALDKGAIKVLAKFAFGATEITATVILNSVHIVGGEYICSYPFDYEGMKLMFNLVVGDGFIGAYYSDLSGGEEVPTSIDMSGLDASGTIVETYADGSTKTSTMEFDADGNPIKITDGDGNVTTLIW